MVAVSLKKKKKKTRRRRIKKKKKTKKKKQKNILDFYEKIDVKLIQIRKNLKFKTKSRIFKNKNNIKFIKYLLWAELYNIIINVKLVDIRIIKYKNKKRR